MDVTAGLFRVHGRNPISISGKHEKASVTGQENVQPAILKGNDISLR